MVVFGLSLILHGPVGELSLVDPYVSVERVVNHVRALFYIFDINHQPIYPYSFCSFFIFCSLLLLLWLFLLMTN